MTLIKPKRYLQSEEKILVPKGAKQTEEYLKIIPNPVGYRLLVRPYSGNNKTEGGVYLSDKTQENIQMTTVVGLVVKMGDLCYKEFVIYGRYAGARFKTKFGEHRILNDDEIIGTIKKPEDILALF